jgi:tetrahydromethanopterin S-methyltransferase subunit F
MELPMDPNGNWGERETYFEGLNKQNAMLNRDRALTGGFDATTKICAELGALLVFQE